ncbi:30S ribosomal protein S6 [SAR202 cluster bacterium AC-409-J13_OGT_754m]|nr:30S ribosomal protein S6 [SAR202 cluster bacterium AC-409-J13_OGT_754m]
MKREYELMLVMNPALSKEDSLGAKDRVKDIIGEEGGEITSEDDWGTRRLAYPIKKAGQPYMEGNYQILRFNMEAHDVSELENQLRLTENVLRHMVVRDPPPNKKTAKTDVKNEENIATDKPSTVSQDDVDTSSGERDDSETQSSKNLTQNTDDKEVNGSAPDSANQETLEPSTEEVNGQSEDAKSKSNDDSDSE